LRELPRNNPTLAMERALSLRKLSMEFASEATETAKTIIQERFLPQRKKTIPPCQIGGIAGGEKYVYVFQSSFFFRVYLC